MFGKEIIVEVTSALIADIKKYCNRDNVKWQDSYYGGRRFMFRINNENSLLRKKYSGGRMDLNYVDILQGICSIIEPSEELVARYNRFGRNVYEALLRRCVFEDERGDDESFYIMLGYKRPFGNSDVEADVEEIINTGKEVEFDEDGELIESTGVRATEEDIEYLVNFVLDYLTEIELVPFEMVYKDYRFSETLHSKRKRKIKGLESL